MFENRNITHTHLVNDDEERVDEDELMCLNREVSTLLKRKHNRSQQGDLSGAADTQRSKVKPTSDLKIKSHFYSLMW